jgi:hypothetical protein
MDDSNTHDIADFASLAADSDIAALLDFEPVPRKIDVPGGWSADKQREVIARLAVHGSANRACDEMGMHRTGLTKVYKSPRAKSFREAWAAAVELAGKRIEAEARAGFVAPGAIAPTIDGRRKKGAAQAGPLPGQVMNERGEWEDEESFLARGEEAKDNIREKLLRCRRHYLMEISGSAGKRAAFEILTELPIDWDKAARMEPQPDEPWKSPSQRQPDMVLTAESGWMFGSEGYGPDKMAELRAELDKFRAEEGLEPVDWGEEDAKPVRGTDEHHSRREEPTPSPQERSGPKLRSL